MLFGRTPARFLEFLLTRSFLDIAIEITFQTAPYLNAFKKLLLRQQNC